MTPFRRVAMLGIGLINGSLAAVLRRQGAAGEIVACARAGRTRARALELGLCDRAEADPAAAVAGADLVVLGVPPAAVGEVAAAMRPGLPDCLRISIGLEAENRRLVAALAGFMTHRPHA